MNPDVIPKHWTDDRERLFERIVAPPRLLVASDFDGTLAPLDVALPPLTMQAGLVWLRHRMLSPAARALVASIRRGVEKLAGDQPGVAAARQSRAPSRKTGTSRRK